MTKFNKAQQKLIDRYTEHYNGWTNSFTFSDFATDLLAVDSTPDPISYKISVSDFGNKLSNDFQKMYHNLTLNEAKEMLKTIFIRLITSDEWPSYKKVSIDDQFLQIKNRENELLTYRIDQDD